MILDISITAKKEDTNAISYALQLIEKGKTKKYPNINKILPINRHLLIAVIQMLSQVRVLCNK